jgi:hypothetical protein
MERSVEILHGEMCGWTAPDGRRLLLSAQLVQDLRALAIEAFLALPRRGIEIGGLLHGEEMRDGMRVDSFEEIVSEHRFGPSYQLSDQDRTHWLERREQDATGIGYFRSFTNRDPLLEAPDEEFARQQHPDGVYFLLMLHPVSHLSCLAEFCFLRKGKPVEGSRSGTFEFDPTQMPLEALQEPEPTLELETELPPQTIPDAPISAAEPPPPMPAPEPPFAELPRPYRARPEPVNWPEPADPRSAPARWPLVLALVLISALLGAAIYQVWVLSSRPRWAELHLDVKPSAGQLEATWDPAAVRTTGASKALLAVTEGGWHRDIQLQDSQLQSGHFAWQRTAEPGDVLVRLILYVKGIGVTGDAVRLQATGLPAPPAPSTTPAAQPANPAPASLDANGKPVNPPVAVHEVQPFVLEGIRSRIEGRIVIPIRVQVSSQGRVTQAVPESEDTGGLNRYLTDQALKAARLWRFTPARTSHGTRTSSTTTLQFVFTP